MRQYSCINAGVCMQAKEAELRAVLSPAGFVWELTVPRSPDGAFPPHSCNTPCWMHPTPCATVRAPLPDDCWHSQVEYAGECQAWAEGWGECAGKARGFAFAGFMCRAHAEKGIKVANGQVIYSPSLFTFRGS